MLQESMDSFKKIRPLLELANARNGIIAFDFERMFYPKENYLSSHERKECQSKSRYEGLRRE